MLDRDALSHKVQTEIFNIKEICTILKCIKYHQTTARWSCNVTQARKTEERSPFQRRTVILPRTDGTEERREKGAGMRV